MNIESETRPSSISYLSLQSSKSFLADLASQLLI